jgi:hypothetical protein
MAKVRAVEPSTKSRKSRSAPCASNTAVASAKPRIAHSISGVRPFRPHRTLGSIPAGVLLPDEGGLFAPLRGIDDGDDSDDDDDDGGANNFFS